MKCPACRVVQLKKAIIQSIEANYCPNCFGMWLEKGDLDVLFEDANEHIYKSFI